MINIPCNECICLAVCKHRTDIVCEIIYNFMDKHLSSRMGAKIGVKKFDLNRQTVWKQVGIQFRKQSEPVTIDKTGNSTGMYMISGKDNQDYDDAVLRMSRSSDV